MIHGKKCTCASAVVMLLCILFQTAVSASPRIDNISLIGQNIHEIADSVALRAETENVVCRKIDIKATSLQAVIRSAVENSFKERHILSSDSLLKIDNIRLEIFENGVFYDRPDGMSGDSVKRTIKTTVYYATTNGANGESENYFKTFSGNITIAKCDTVGTDEISFLERGGNSVAKGILPKAKTTFWKQVLTPAIVVGSAIICVILLFSVRSK